MRSIVRTVLTTVMIDLKINEDSLFLKMRRTILGIIMSHLEIIEFTQGSTFMFVFITLNSIGS